MKDILSKNKWLNKYSLTALAFALWIVLLDGQYSLIKQYKLNKQIHKMELERDSYITKLEDAKEEYEDLKSNPEKYAREKYFISKPGEEVYIIE